MNGWKELEGGKKECARASECESVAIGGYLPSSRFKIGIIFFLLVLWVVLLHVEVCTCHREPHTHPLVSLTCTHTRRQTGTCHTAGAVRLPDIICLLAWCVRVLESFGSLFCCDDG